MQHRADLPRLGPAAQEAGNVVHLGASHVNCFFMQSVHVLLREMYLHETKSPIAMPTRFAQAHVTPRSRLHRNAPLTCTIFEAKSARGGTAMWVSCIAQKSHHCRVCSTDCPDLQAVTCAVSMDQDWDDDECASLATTADPSSKVADHVKRRYLFSPRVMLGSVTSGVSRSNHACGSSYFFSSFC